MAAAAGPAPHTSGLHLLTTALHGDRRCEGVEAVQLPRPLQLDPALPLSAPPSPLQPAPLLPHHSSAEG